MGRVNTRELSHSHMSSTEPADNEEREGRGWIGRGEDCSTTETRSRTRELITVLVVYLQPTVS